MTLEEIKSFSDMGGRGIFLAENELKKLVERAAQNEQRLAEALTKGKTDDYARLLAEKDIIAEKIRQKRDYIARQPRYATRGDIIGGFNQAAEAYNASFRKKYGAFMKAKKDLYAICRGEKVSSVAAGTGLTVRDIVRIKEDAIEKLLYLRHGAAYRP